MKNIENLNIDASAKENVMTWLNGQYDEETKQAIRDMMDNPNELNESFYRSLEFGTGGLRGIMGVGTNRMNKYTVAMATQGLANYVKKCFPTYRQCVGRKRLPCISVRSIASHSRAFVCRAPLRLPDGCDGDGEPQPQGV